MCCVLGPASQCHCIVSGHMFYVRLNMKMLLCNHLMCVLC